MSGRRAVACLLAILGVAAMACQASPAPAATEPAAADPATLLERARETRGATGAIAVLQRGGTRTFLTVGTADVAGTPIDETTRFRIASITKPIVAALVLDAVARGEVSLDDQVGEVLPGVVRDLPVITVRQLLDHTSGVFDEGNEGDLLTDIDLLTDPALREEARVLVARYVAGESVIAPARLIVALAETHDRYFFPGEGYHYSNVNYQLAGMVLEQATGQSLADLLRQRIVEPLGLTRTTLAPPDIGSPELRGYVRPAPDADPVDLTDDLSWFGNGGNGGVVSTPDELMEMLKAIVTARLFPEALVTEMERVSRASYGLGLGTNPLPCGTFYGHGGLVSGTQSIALVSPDGTDGVVIAINLADPAEPDLNELAEVLLCQDP